MADDTSWIDTLPLVTDPDHKLGSNKYTRIVSRESHPKAMQDKMDERKNRNDE